MSRTLNLAERRKVEKVIESKFTVANCAIDLKDRKLKRELVQQLEKNVPSDIKKIFEKATKLRKEITSLSEKAHKLGWNIDTYTTQPHLRLTGYSRGTVDSLPSNIPSVRKAQEEIHKMRKEVNDLHDKMTISLFVDGTEVMETFNEIVKRLEKLTK